MMDEVKFMKGRMKKAELIVQFKIKGKSRKKVFKLTDRKITLGTGIDPVDTDFVYYTKERILFTNPREDNDHITETIAVNHAILTRNEEGCYAIKNNGHGVIVNSKVLSPGEVFILKSKAKVKLGTSYKTTNSL